MNSLSWLIYLAGVLGNLQTMLIMLAAFIVVSVVISIIAMNIDHENEDDEWLFPSQRWFIIAIMSALAASILPSKDTMYAIAASEVGGKIAQTEMAQETANDAMLALRAWLKKQQEPTK